MPPTRTPISSMMMSATNDETILPKAAPMITPTARSTTLPLTANSRNSFSQPLMGRSASWIRNFKDLQLLGARRRAQRHLVALARLEQRARHRRDPRDIAFPRIGLVDADDAHRALAARAAHAHLGAEEDLVGVAARRAHDLGRLEALDEKAHAAVDLAQPALAIDVVGVLRAVAQGCRPGHGLHHLGALDVEQVLFLALQAREALGSNVILAMDGQRGGFGFLGLRRSRVILHEGLRHGQILA